MKNMGMRKPKETRAELSIRAERASKMKQTILIHKYEHVRRW